MAADGVHHDFHQYPLARVDMVRNSVEVPRPSQSPRWGAPIGRATSRSMRCARRRTPGGMSAKSSPELTKPQELRIRTVALLVDWLDRAAHATAEGNALPPVAEVPMTAEFATAVQGVVFKIAHRDRAVAQSAE